jgi:hypothetical protein
VIADEPPVQVRAAADELADHLEQVTGAEFPIESASSASGAHRILVGPSQALSALKLEIDYRDLGPEGFVIRTVDRALVIAGGPQRGTINGVYTFLDDVIGCRWYTPTFSVIPQRRILSLAPINLRYVPPFESRFVLGSCASHIDWAARQRLNTLFLEVAVWTPGNLKTFIDHPKLAGSIYYAGSPHHTLGHNGLLPYDEFDAHPDYFALVNGRRFREGQPCMTHPDLLPLVVRNAKKWIEDRPGARILSISQRDGDFVHHGCHCTRCNDLYAKQTLTEVNVNFVNRVAAELVKDHPDVLVDTLAYHWTRKPPKNLKMHENTVVRYCLGGATCYFHGIDQCELNAERGMFEDLREWIRISPRVWVWYYVHGGDELHPISVFNSISHNFKRMRDAGVKGFFIQTAWGKILKNAERRDRGGLLDLQAYLFAKVIWDPDYDVQKGIEEFCRDCYGEAAPQILEYIKMVNEETAYVGVPPYTKSAVEEYPSAFKRFHAAGGWMMPMRPEKLWQIDALFDEAEGAVAEDPGALERVKFVRLSVQYAILVYSDPSGPTYAKALRDFPPVAKRAGIHHVRRIKDRAEVVLDAFLEERRKLAELSVIRVLPDLADTWRPPAGTKLLAETPEFWLFRQDPDKVGQSDQWFAPSTAKAPPQWRAASTRRAWEKGYIGHGWYALDMVIPETGNRPVWLHFGGVDENYTLWINGQYISDNMGAGPSTWDQPVSVEITGKFNPGASNHIVVRARNTASAGGIWKPVSLITER